MKNVMKLLVSASAALAIGASAQAGTFFAGAGINAVDQVKVEAEQGNASLNYKNNKPSFEIRGGYTEDMWRAFAAVDLAKGKKKADDVEFSAPMSFAVTGQYIFRPAQMQALGLAIGGDLAMAQYKLKNVDDGYTVKYSPMQLGVVASALYNFTPNIQAELSLDYTVYSGKKSKDSVDYKAKSPMKLFLGASYVF